MPSRMQHDLVHFMAKAPGSASEDEFNTLARGVFLHQYTHCLPYRHFCDSKSVTQETIRTWKDIPPLPVLAFKWAELSCLPIDQAARLFYSSGTTGNTRSRHYLFDLSMTRAAILAHFKRHLLPDFDQMRLFFLTPPPEEAPHASLSYMMSVLGEFFGSAGSDYYIRSEKLESARLMKDLSETDQPVMLLGPSFSFVHLMDACEAEHFQCNLPQGSRLMDTGGFKGKSRMVSQDGLYENARKLWGISDEYCINEYGMSEMSSQCYDRLVGEAGSRIRIAPVQLKTRVLCPETLKELPEGEIGLLAHCDLANLDSVSSILTEDLGKKVPGGFRLLGRADGAEAKGCSLSMDQLLG